MKSINRATKQVMNTVALESPTMLSLKANSLARQERECAKLLPDLRKDLLKIFIKKMDRMEPELKEILHLETGCSRLSAEKEFGASKEVLKLFSDVFVETLSPTAVKTTAKKSLIYKLPIGLTLVASEGNHPLYRFCQMLGENLTLGNPMLFRCPQGKANLAGYLKELVSAAELDFVDVAFCSSEGTKHLIEQKSLKAVYLEDSAKEIKKLAETCGFYLKSLSFNPLARALVVIDDDSGVQPFLEFLKRRSEEVQGTNVILGDPEFHFFVSRKAERRLRDKLSEIEELMKSSKFITSFRSLASFSSNSDENLESVFFLYDDIKELPPVLNQYKYAPYVSIFTNKPEKEEELIQTINAPRFSRKIIERWEHEFYEIIRRGSYMKLVDREVFYRFANIKTLVADPHKNFAG